jgi:hypothetical protein
MKLEVHTFDPELLNLLMGKDEVLEGDSMTLNENALLKYERTFSRKVKAFPRILHFTVEVGNDEGACAVVDWLFNQVDKRNLEKIVIEYRDVRMDAEEMKRLLCPP